MTGTLRDALDDLATGEALFVSPADLAAASWRAGRRRLAVRRVAASVALLALVAGIAFTLLPLVTAGARAQGPADGGERVDGYPAHIAVQSTVDALPARPGPVAAVLQRTTRTPTSTEIEGWYVVGPTGTLWHLPAPGNASAIVPTLSPDGRYLGYLAADGGPYVIRDLVAGGQTSFDQVALIAQPYTTPYVVDEQTPSFWSPDGKRLLVSGRHRDGQSDAALILGPAGSVTVVASTAQSSGYALAGWIDDNSLAFVSWPFTQLGNGSNAVVTVRITSTTGQLLRSVDLKPASSWQSDLYGQWAGTVSPDGTQLLITEEGGVVRRFDLDSGRENGNPVIVRRVEQCGAQWVGADLPAIPALQGVNASTAVVRDGQLTYPVEIDAALGSSCVVWAGYAFGGGPRSPAGAPSWVWVAGGVGAALLLVAAAACLLVRRRRLARFGRR